MKALLAKDLYQLKNNSLFITLFYLPFIIFYIYKTINAQKDDSMYMLWAEIMILFPSAFVLATFSSDINSGYIQHIFVTPIKPKDYINAKYILFLIVSVISSALNLIVLLIFCLSVSVKNLTFYMELILISQITGFILVVLSTSLFMKKKDSSSMAKTIAITISLFSIAVVLISVIRILHFKVNIALSAGLSVISIIITFFLFIMNYRWAEKKEF